MKKSIITGLILMLMLALTACIVSAQTAEPTQTPYIIYIVVTATPEPEPVPETAPTDDPGLMIQRPESTAAVSIVNDQTGSGEVSIVNQSSGGTASSTDDLVRMIVATVMAQSNTTAGGSTTTVQNTYSSGGALVHQSGGSTCTMNFELVSEPTYPAGSIVPRGEIFWKEWVIRNTGTCTWTQDWEFVFDRGWQIGNTRFSMKRNTAPGETLTVRLAMVPDQKENGNYYSTYAFEAPDGTRYGTITSSYTVKDPSYFYPTATPAPYGPYPGKPVCPGDPWCPGPPPWYPPHW